MPMTDDRSPAEVLRLYGEATASFGRRVAGVAPNQWTAPTACRDWTVGRLVGVLIAEQARVPALLAGAAPADRLDAPPAGPAAVEDWARAAEAARAAFAAPGALARTVRTTDGERPAVAHCAHLTVELTLHTWDLAHATGQDPHLSPELTAFALHESGVPLPADGDPQPLLLALFGRHCEPPPALDPELFG
jgi:uncharacterized protein (TIGR03086 family)